MKKQPFFLGAHVTRYQLRMSPIEIFAFWLAVVFIFTGISLMVWPVMRTYFVFLAGMIAGMLLMIGIDWLMEKLEDGPGGNS
ncbi:hypothetical protein [Candidatus Manganitrophus noduliformans]|uniref:Uncharacterized protein n=1 Tax=Candidatus Manganitrophus noduliformans TaxID=2606439 RepID=A0A7X6DMU9_9BACT|nr:hypothetical protein [Candidatus Manganitrophus noduliformans]NKE69843.1 hypothetical protein [Candidatus Manganitrophus noduliformans]